MKINFLDLVSPHPYHKGSLEERPMGGTEASVIRVATALDKCGHETKISNDPSTWGDVTVVLRNPCDLKYPESPCVLWEHDLMSREWISDESIGLCKKKADRVIGVSKFHKDQLTKVLGTECFYIYNPVAEYCKPGIRDPFKLCFLSSPHKGLKKTLEVMAELLKWDDRYRLHIANPGYYPSSTISTEKVINHGEMLHKDAMALLATCQLMIQANDVFPETMGIVYAEANSCGVPAITYDIGAAKEIGAIVLPIGTTAKEFASAVHAMCQSNASGSSDEEAMFISHNWEYHLEKAVA